MTNALLSKLTLIIPTYGRERYALRCMRYWSDRGVTVHVMDGSPLPISLSDVERFARNIHYHHLPASLATRLQKSLDLIDTEYAILGSDDEFFLPSGLSACISELDSQPELVSCMGRCIRFDFDSDSDLAQVVGWADYLSMENYCISQDNSIDRMVAHMNPYTCSTIYSVVRSPAWQLAFSIFAKREYPVYAIGELQFELAICYQGKSKVLPELMWLRSEEAPPTRGTDPSLLPQNTFVNWWLDPAKKIDHADFLTVMSSALAEDELRISGVKEGVRTALDAYTQFSLRLRSGSSPDSFSGRLKRFVVSRLSLKHKKKLKIFLSSFLKAYRFTPMPLMQSAKALAETGVKVNVEELMEIEATINEFHTPEYGAPKHSV